MATVDALALIPAMDRIKVHTGIIGYCLTVRPAVEDGDDGVLLCHGPQIMTDLVIRQRGQDGD